MTRARIHLPTVIAMATVVYAAAIALHELGHVVFGLLAGGDPSFVSTTDTRGDWSGLGRAGFFALGAGGSLVNALLATVGALLLRLEPRPTGHLFAWLLFAVNGSLAAFYLLISPLAGIGDWDTVARRFAPSWPLRLMLAAAGAALTVWVIRIAGKRLAPFVTLLPSETREVAASLARSSWLTGGALAVAAALWSPLGVGWALFVALGSTLGCTWPLMTAARLAVEEAAGVEAEGPGGLEIPPQPAWIVAGTLVAALFVFVLGPGLTL